MKVTLHLEGNRQEVLNQIDEFRTVLSTSLDSQKPAGSKPKTIEKSFVDEEEAEPVSDKKKKPKKAPEPEAEEGEAEEGEAEESSEDDMGFTAEEEEDEEEPEEEVTISQSDVIEACRKFTKGKPANKEKIGKLLGKFKVKSVLDLKKEKFADFLASLKKL